MNIRGFRQPLLLFVVTVLVPGLILTAFTIRTIRQERELAGTKMAEERRRAAEAIGQTVLRRLENIRTRSRSARAEIPVAAPRATDPELGIILALPIVNRELRPPWEDARPVMADPSSRSGYRVLLEAGDRAEFRDEDFRAAERAFRRALSMSDSPDEAASARLGLARVLTKRQRTSEARDEYLRLLEGPLALADEFGVPFAYFAASRLLEFGVQATDVINRLADGPDKNLWLSPTALSKLADIIAGLEAATTPPQGEGSFAKAALALERARRRTDQVLKLGHDFASIIFLLRDGSDGDQSSRWVLYGDDPWFVTVDPGEAEDRPSLLAVEARRVYEDSLAEVKPAQAFPGGARLVAEAASGALRLGPSLPGANVLFDVDEPSAWIGSSLPPGLFYVLALALVFGVTGFGTYLFWRDMRRDYRSAELRSQFVSSVSHELKTPLTSIRMFAEALALKRPRAEAEKSDYLRTIVTETERLSRLINNVLDFSKIEQGTRTYRKENVRLENVVRNAARTMAYPLEQQGFRLRLSLEEGLPEIRGDGDALEQAALNLLHNAVKYSGESRAIELRLYRKGGHAVIAVEDQGIGISPEEKDRICDKYYRGSAAVNSRISGAGLGLAIVKHIVEAHQGRLEVDSQKGGGSVFSIIIPVPSEGGHP
jgi:anti-sigma regulatory factor (Ser/Thr protein kinase)